MHRNILVAIDTTPSSSRALAHASGLAESLDARLAIETPLLVVEGERVEET